jgi:hypothetical protein
LTEQSIAREAPLDGIYVIRTSVLAAALAAWEAVRPYKRLAEVEQVFRSFKSVDPKILATHHRLE